METKEYNLIMQEMIKYATMSGSDTLNFETYSQLYHKLIAMLAHSEESKTQGVAGFTYSDSGNNLISIRLNEFQTQLKNILESAKKDEAYKLEVNDAKMLNQFARVTEFKYVPRENAVSDQSIDYAIEYFRKLAGLKP
jgi:hypothetical protein